MEHVFEYKRRKTEALTAAKALRAVQNLPESRTAFAFDQMATSILI
jgi:hypothetical protein